MPRVGMSRLLNFDEAAQRTDGTASETCALASAAVSVQALDCSRLLLIAPALSFKPTRPRLGRHHRYFRHSPRPIEILRDHTAPRTTRQRPPAIMSGPYGRSDHGR